jgi:hypothetical protein
MTDNDGPAVDDSGEHAASPIDETLRSGLALLWQAYRYALDTGVDAWEFALENDELYKTAVTISDLRWMVVKGFAEHAQETSFYSDPHRSFRRSHGLNFAPTTCFVLTPKGADFAGRIMSRSAAAYSP